ncbi:MAG TPA: NAD(P)-binding domain-containing protein [Pseudonocardiaceae bacterium]
MPEHHRFVVLGAGPAGLQLCHFLAAAGADVIALEREDAPGGFFRVFPRHRRLISLNKTHCTADEREIRLRWDWNSLLPADGAPDLGFAEFSGEYFPHADDMVRYLAAFRDLHALPVRHGTTVHHVERAGDGRFVLATGGEPITADCLIVATGWGKPYVPGIPGIEHAVGYERMTVCPAAYTGHRVLVIGKGNSAFETATALLGRTAMVHLASRRPLRLAWNSKHPGDVRGQYGALLDSYQFKTLHSVLDCEIDAIRPVAGGYQADITYTHADGERATLTYDSVLRCTGFAMDTAIFGPGVAPAMTRDGRIPELRPDWSSTTVDGLYFAGTIAVDRDFRRASSAFVDGFRYNLRTLTALLLERYEGRPLPRATLPATPEALTTLILDRVNWSSALWTQFEYLCDALVLRDGTATHYRDLPEDLAVRRFADADELLTVTLRWGRDPHPDVFAIERHPRPDRAAESAFVHPVVRRHRRGELVEELHLLEDLLAEWRREDRHAGPLRAFLTARSAAWSGR